MKTPANILSYIPQRPPVVMVDELVYSDERISRSVFLVKEDNIFVEDGLFKEPGLAENIAQTAAARAGYISFSQETPVQLGYIGAIKNLEIFFLPKAGDQLITEIIIENQIFNVTLITGTVRCREMPAARCEMKIFINQK